jgi:PurA ssDNA and RNA-binding protein
MMSHERRYSSSNGYRNSGVPHPPPPEETIRTEKFQVERKVFVLSLKENPRGRFLRITEDVGGRRDHVIIPASGLEDLRHAIEDMIQADQETPARLTEE